MNWPLIGAFVIGVGVGVFLCALYWVRLMIEYRSEWD